MNFRDALERICARVEGAMAAVIIAGDGIIVERHSASPSLDLELVSVEFMGASREVKRATEAAHMGDLDEMVVTNSSGITLLRRIGPGYYLLLIMDVKGLLGRGRFELRRAAHDLANEFA